MKKETMNKSKLNRKTVYTVVILGALVAISVVACGGHGHDMSPQMMKRLFLGHVDDVMDDIDATDAQRATFEATAEEILAEALEMKKTHKAHEKEMLTLLKAPSPDRDAIKAHIQDKLDRVEDFAIRSVDKILDAYETLDSGQRQIILDKLAKHLEKH